MVKSQTACVPTLELWVWTWTSYVISLLNVDDDSASFTWILWGFTDLISTNPLEQCQTPREPSENFWYPEAVLPALPLETPHPSRPPANLLQHPGLLLRCASGCSYLKHWERLGEMSTCQSVSLGGKWHEAFAQAGLVGPGHCGPAAVTAGQPVGLLWVRSVPLAVHPLGSWWTEHMYSEPLVGFIYCSVLLVWKTFLLHP